MILYGPQLSHRHVAIDNDRQLHAQVLSHVCEDSARPYWKKRSLNVHQAACLCVPNGPLGSVALESSSGEKDNAGRGCVTCGHSILPLLSLHVAQ